MAEAQVIQVINIFLFLLKYLLFITFILKYYVINILLKTLIKNLLLIKPS
jgi:hypothetical protein